MKDKINPGIAKTVEWLNKNQFVTCDSGDGETHDHECDQDRAYIHMIVPNQNHLVLETQRLIRLLDQQGIKIESMNEDNTAPCIEASYCPAANIATITLWNVRIDKDSQKGDK